MVNPESNIYGHQGLSLIQRKDDNAICVVADVDVDRHRILLSNDTLSQFEFKIFEDRAFGLFFNSNKKSESFKHNIINSRDYLIWGAINDDNEVLLINRLISGEAFTLQAQNNSFDKICIKTTSSCEDYKVKQRHEIIEGSISRHFVKIIVEVKMKGMVTFRLLSEQVFNLIQI